MGAFIMCNLKFIRSKFVFRQKSYIGYGPYVIAKLVSEELTVLTLANGSIIDMCLRIGFLSDV